MMAQSNLDEARYVHYTLWQNTFSLTVGKREDMQLGWPSGHLRPKFDHVVGTGVGSDLCSIAFANVMWESRVV